AYHRGFSNAVRFGDAFMLAQMLEPGRKVKGFDEAELGTRRVFVDAPIVSTVAPSLPAQSVDRLKKSGTVLWPYRILDRYHHRAAVRRNIMRQNRRRPMHGRR